MTWGCKYIPIRFGASKISDALYIANLKRNGYNIRVFSCSWIGMTREFVDILESEGILVVAGSGNGTRLTTWGVQGAGTDNRIVMVGCVQKDYGVTYWSFGSEDSNMSYGVHPNNEHDKHLDLMGYAPSDCSLFKWTEPYGYSLYDVDVDTHIPAVTLGWARCQGEDWIETGGGLPYRYLTNMGADLDAGYDIASATEEDPVVIPTLMHSLLMTSGTTPQAAGVAALYATLYPESSTGQIRHALFRGSVNVDSYNTMNCCSGTYYEDCHTFDDKGDGDPDNDEWRRNAFDRDCAGLLGHGRLDAYRTITMWGVVQDTTLSGDIYVSGDVEFRGTVNIEEGTHFYVAPDDITNAAPWDAGDYNMGSGVVTSGFQTSGSESVIEIMCYIGSTVNFNGTETIVFESFVEGDQGTDDWLGVRNLYGTATVNGTNYSIQNATNSTIFSP